PSEPFVLKPAVVLPISMERCAPLCRLKSPVLMMPVLLPGATVPPDAAVRPPAKVPVPLAVLPFWIVTLLVTVPLFFTSPLNAAAAAVAPLLMVALPLIVRLPEIVPLSTTAPVVPEPARLPATFRAPLTNPFAVKVCVLNTLNPDVPFAVVSKVAPLATVIVGLPLMPPNAPTARVPALMFVAPVHVPPPLSVTVPEVVLLRVAAPARFTLTVPLIASIEPVSELPPCANA